MLEIKRWLSVEEIAKHLGISKEIIYRWTEKSKIPAHKVGLLIRWTCPQGGPAHKVGLAHKVGRRQWKFKVSESKREPDEWVTLGGACEK